MYVQQNEIINTITEEMDCFAQLMSVHECCEF